MTVVIFKEYITEINELMRVSNKKILLVDNASSHVNIQNLSNVKIVFIPAKMTSHIQPMTCGFIHSFKIIYRIFLVELLIKNAEMNI